MSSRGGNPDVDISALADATRKLASALRTMGEPEPLFLARRDGGMQAALLLKRTYKIEGGSCVLAPPDEQPPVILDDVPYGLIEPPRVAPVIAVDEGYPFKPFTDVVIQGRAYTYGPKINRTTVSLRFRDVERTINVIGDRRGEVDQFGRMRFSEPEPFQALAVRWDRAYGGYDATALRRHGNAFQERIAELRGKLSFDETPYHYPRNPAGRGYLISLDEESFKDLSIPNLEHPFEPLTPERLAVGATGAWIRGPLPAAWDYQPLGWFPRCGYLGLSPPYLLDGDEQPAEVTRGWATADLLSIPPVMHLASPGDVRLEVCQAAAPGLWSPLIAPDERFELESFHRSKKRHVITLPGEVPDVLFEITKSNVVPARVHLSTVVLRVDLDEVELLWSARITLPAGVTPEQVGAGRRIVRWSRPKEKS